MEKWKKKISDLKEEGRQYEEVIDELSEERKTAKKSLDSIMDESEEMVRKCKIQKSNLERESAKTDTFKRRLADLKKRVQDLSLNNDDDSDQTMEASEEDLSQMKIVVKDLETCVFEKERRIKALEASVAKETASLDTLTKKHTKLENDCRILDSISDASQESEEFDEDAARDTIKGLEVEIRDLSIKRETVERKVQNLTKTKMQLKTEIDRLNQDIAKLKADME